MSNPTTPFGWQMPTATDLVTDLPADFEVFGQAVATSMADLLGGTTGQILAKNSNTDMDFVWVANDVGDITAVTAGTGITGGGPSGAVTVSFDQANFGGGQYAAGKNKIINGDFKINARAFTSNTATNSFNFDRFSQFNGGTSGTLTTSPQVFTPGAAPVAGYEGTNFLQGITAAGADTNTFAGFYQRIESVRTFANQAVTVSFYAKATTGTPKIGVEVTQNFGTGGSPSAEVNTAAGAVTISTSWVRYSVSFTVPSISGKTLGTTNDGYLQANLWLSGGSAVAARSSSIGIQNNTFQIWGVQVEAGSTATPFQTASGGSPQAELAMCQRYYHRFTGGGSSDSLINSGLGFSTTVAMFVFNLGTTMRTAPASMDVSNQGIYRPTNATSYSGGTWALNQTFDNNVRAIYTHGSAVFVAGESLITASTSSSNYFAFSAEL